MEKRFLRRMPKSNTSYLQRAMKELQSGFFQDEELVEYSGLFWNQFFQMRWTIFLPLYGSMNENESPRKRFSTVRRGSCSLDLLTRWNVSSHSFLEQNLIALRLLSCLKRTSATKMIMSMLNVCGENLENLYDKKSRSCAQWGYSIRKLLKFLENILLEKYCLA